MSLKVDIKITPVQEKNKSCIQVTKLLLMGPAGAGKSAFGDNLERVFNGDYKPSLTDVDCKYVPTPGIDFYRIFLQEEFHSYVLWELGGQPIFQSLWKLWWNGAKGAFIVLDSSIIDADYLSQVRELITIVDRDLSLPFIICLNKQDLVHSYNPNVSTLESISVMLGVPKDRITHTSVVTGFNVKESFHRLVDLMTDFKY